MPVLEVSTEALYFNFACGIHNFSLTTVILNLFSLSLTSNTEESYMGLDLRKTDG
jgi:hypothetical protein